MSKLELTIGCGTFRMSGAITWLILVAAALEAGLDKLCEINVIEQVINAGQTTVMQDARRRGQTVSIHGWIYYIPRDFSGFAGGTRQPKRFERFGIEDD
ncbi:MAG: Carbonic anhydrase, beta class [uncultured Pyrinomonadaceae bacterium]|uniref:Carbonic anhydrase, beta class n=1 Tax=uncultured Pyrinomonadaceae bacterium TaxID=2283094 RepID=A0A6J4PYX6_9BACT|nr:MAG: Carbonic anhydrase, beta class [uncultured Pyrinomonadaceae bacterium]